MKFLYMDETYPDFTLPRSAWAVCLTGMLVPAERHREIRMRFYKAVTEAVKSPPNMVPQVTEVHAAALFPSSNDETRIAFLNEIADIVLDFDLSFYRVGYRRTRLLLNTFKTDGQIIGIAFHGLLALLSKEMETTSIWPVMETDRTNAQDQQFTGAVQRTDQIEAYIGSEMLSRDQANLGEVLYCTKRSTHGAMVDCVAYLLNIRTVAGPWRRVVGIQAAASRCRR